MRKYANYFISRIHLVHDERTYIKYGMLTLLCWAIWAALDQRAHWALATVCLTYGIVTLLWLKKPATRLSLDRAMRHSKSWYYDDTFT